MSASFIIPYVASTGTGRYRYWSTSRGVSRQSLRYTYRCLRSLQVGSYRQAVRRSTRYGVEDNLCPPGGTLHHSCSLCTSMVPIRSLCKGPIQKSRARDDMSKRQYFSILPLDMSIQKSGARVYMPNFLPIGTTQFLKEVKIYKS